MLTCQECNSIIPLDGKTPEIGEIIICPECGAEYEVASSEPLIINLIEEEK